MYKTLSVIAALAASFSGLCDSRPALAQYRLGAQAQAPDDYRINLMIRSVLIALNQANSTGNYSVLRDLGSPAFQYANNPARLAEIFAPLRARKVDLSPVIFFNPKLYAAPAVQEGNTLRLTGFIPTVPEQVNFDLSFQAVGDQWLLAGLAVTTALPDPLRNAQAIALQSPYGQAGGRDQGGNGFEGKTPGEAKPIRIDLNEPGAPPKKLPIKKPKPPAQKVIPAGGTAQSDPKQKQPPAPQPAPEAEPKKASEAIPEKQDNASDWKPN